MTNKPGDWETNLTQKLVVGQNVEVLSEGSWHSGTVLAKTLYQRTVIYHHLFQTDHPQSNNLIETVPVSLAIDGILPTETFSQFLHLNLNNYAPKRNAKRNGIRPLARRRPLEISEGNYGTCVDACVRNAHWEGVILDHATDNRHVSTVPSQRNVFFPDLGIEESVPVQDLSVSSDWDEITGEWSFRGRWKFLEALEANRGLMSANLGMLSVRQLWQMARHDFYFVAKIGAWTCGGSDEWYGLVRNLMHRINVFGTSVPVRSCQEVTASVPVQYNQEFANSVPVQSGHEGFTNSVPVKYGQEFNAFVPVQSVQEFANSVPVQSDQKFTTSVPVQSDQEFADSIPLQSDHEEFANSIPLQSDHEEFPTPVPAQSSQKSSNRTKITKNTPNKKKKKKKKKPTKKRSSRRTHRWSPVNLSPKFSKLLVRGSNNTAEYEDIAKDTMRKHLLHLGWIVEQKTDFNRPLTRFRYHSPDGKTYYSLNLIINDPNVSLARRIPARSKF